MIHRSRRLAWRLGLALAAIQVACLVSSSLWMAAILRNADEAAAAVRILITGAMACLVLSLIAVWRTFGAFRRATARMAAGLDRWDRPDAALQPSQPVHHELALLAEALQALTARMDERIRALQAHLNDHQAIHESMSNGMIALDLNQRVLSMNRAAHRLLALDGAIGRGRLLQEILREPELNRFLDHAVAAGRQVDAEFSLRSSGTTVQVLSEPLRTARGELVGVLLLLTDVTHVRRLESIRSDFAANVSHELRTPITSIKGYVETLIELGVDDRVQAERFLATIKRSTDRLASIIEDLLSLARLEQPEARATLERVEVPIARALEMVVAQFEQEIKGKSMIVDADAPNALRVNANPQLLEQAIGNLLSNAVKYSPPGTQVSVTARSRGGALVEISVADRGPGIASEHLPRIFERFYRVDRARSRELGGTGLGLSIVKHIALVHGGSVEVESHVGRGSTFRLILPSA